MLDPQQRHHGLQMPRLQSALLDSLRAVQQSLVKLEMIVSRFVAAQVFSAQCQI
jgi:hypothetical protein